MAESLLSSEQIQAMIVRQAQAWEEQDAQAIADDFASVKIKRTIIDGNCGAVEWDWRDQNRQTGKKGFAEDAIIFELANGKIVYWREYIEKKK
jgi:ketosteroid isomerase-like protein